MSYCISWGQALKPPSSLRSTIYREPFLLYFVIEGQEDTALSPPVGVLHVIDDYYLFPRIPMSVLSIQLG